MVSTTFRTLGAALLLLVFLAPAGALGQDGASRPRRALPGQTPGAAPPAAQAPDTRAPNAQAPDGDALQLRSDLVTLTVSVADAAGRAVTGLTPKDFRVYESGKPQTIEHFQLTGDPYTLLLVVDLSGSTANQVEILRSAASQFVAGLGPEDKIGVIAFSREIEILGDPTSDRAELARQLASLTNSSSQPGAVGPKFSQNTGTSFYDAAYLACVESPLAEMKGSGRRAVVLISDCVDSSSSFTFDAILGPIERSGIGVYALQVDTQGYSDTLLTNQTGSSSRVNFSPSQLDRFYDAYYPNSDERGRDPRTYTTLERLEINRALYEVARGEAKRLAERTGGRVYPVASFSDLPKAYAAIAAEFRTRYSIDYYPTNEKHDGTWRPLRVEVPGRPSAVIVARPGYWAPRD